MGEATKHDAYLDASIRGWIVLTARKHYWKVARWHELDDLIQDGYLCYAKCRARFKPKNEGDEPSKEDRKRFMAYFMRSFENRIVDLANRHTRTPEAAMADLGDRGVDTIASWAENAAELGDVSVAAALAKAPAEILDIIKQILVEGVAETPFLRTRLRKKILPGSKIPRMVKGRRYTRETTSEHYDRCLGKVGVVDQLRAYFSTSGTS